MLWLQGMSRRHKRKALYSVTGHLTGRKTVTGVPVRMGEECVPSEPASQVSIQE